MQTLRKLLDFYLDASIHVALAVLALFWITVYFLNLAPNYYLAGLVFFGSIVFYNIAKDSIGVHSVFRGSKRYYRSVRFLSMASLLVALFFFFQLSAVLRWRIVLVAALAGLYLIPLPGKRPSMRYWAWLKVTWVGFAWSAVTVFLPVSASTFDEQGEWILLALQRVLMVVSMMIPFEIRDAATDPEGMQTIPQRFGLRTTRWVGYTLLLLFFVLIFLRERFSLVELAFGFVFAVVMYLGIRGARPRQDRYYASFWIEAIPIFLWMGLWWLL